MSNTNKVQSSISLGNGFVLESSNTARVNRVLHADVRGFIFNNSTQEGYLSIDSEYSNEKARAMINSEKNAGRNIVKFENSKTGQLTSYHNGTVFQNAEEFSNFVNGKISFPVKQFRNDAEQILTTLTRRLEGVQQQKIRMQKIEDLVPVVRDGNTYNDKIIAFQQRYTTNGGLEETFKDASSISDLYGKTNLEVQEVETKIVHFVHGAKETVIGRGTYEAAIGINKTEALMRGVAEFYQKSLEKMILGEGITGRTDIQGLSNATVGTEISNIITAELDTLNDADFISAVAKIVPAYVNVTNDTYRPNIFAMPSSQKTTLAGQVITSLMPYQNRLQYLESTLSAAAEERVEIQGNVYFEKSKNAQGKHIYMIYRKDPEVISMYLTNPFITTAPFSMDGFVFNFTSTASQSGVWVRVPQAVVRFSHA